MHLYAQWAMERVCGMMTRTAKSRICANRNMEITLLLTEQKYVLTYVLANEDWNGALDEVKRRERNRERQQRERSRSALGNIGNDEDESDWNDEGDFDLLGLERNMASVNLADVFQDRALTGRPQIAAIDVKRVQGLTLNFGSESRMAYKLIGAIGNGAVTPDPTEIQRLREFISKLDGYQPEIHAQMTLPVGSSNGGIHKYRWCSFADLLDNRKLDFKVTSSAHKPNHNKRSSSFIQWVEPTGNNYDFGNPNATRYKSCYGEVEYFFTAELPVELSLPEDIMEADDHDDDANMVLQALAKVRRFEMEADGHLLVRKRPATGALAIIHVKWIKQLVGFMTVGEDQYLIKKNKTLLDSRPQERAV